MPDSMKAQQDQILQCFKQMDDMFHVYALGQGLPDCAFWILYALLEAERPYTQNDFCEEWHYTKQTVHSAVSYLVKKGYVGLEHVPGTRNSKRISLTEVGRSYVDAHIRPLQDAERRAFEGLSDEERADYMRLVKKHLALFGGALGALKGGAGPSGDLPL